MPLFAHLPTNLPFGRGEKQAGCMSVMREVCHPKRSLLWKPNDEVMMMTNAVRIALHKLELLAYMDVCRDIPDENPRNHRETGGQGRRTQKAGRKYLVYAVACSKLSLSDVGFSNFFQGPLSSGPSFYRGGFFRVPLPQLDPAWDYTNVEE